SRRSRPPAGSNDWSWGYCPRRPGHSARGRSSGADKAYLSAFVPPQYIDSLPVRRDGRGFFMRISSSSADAVLPRIPVSAASPVLTVAPLWPKSVECFMSRCIAPPLLSRGRRLLSSTNFALLRGSWYAISPSYRSIGIDGRGRKPRGSVLIGGGESFTEIDVV